MTKLHQCLLVLAVFTAGNQLKAAHPGATRLVFSTEGLPAAPAGIRYFDMETTRRGMVLPIKCDGSIKKDGEAFVMTILAKIMGQPFAKIEGIYTQIPGTNKLIPSCPTVLRLTDRSHADRFKELAAKADSLLKNVASQSGVVIEE